MQGLKRICVDIDALYNAMMLPAGSEVGMLERSGLRLTDINWSAQGLGFKYSFETYHGLLIFELTATRSEVQLLQATAEQAGKADGREAVWRFR